MFVKNCWYVAAHAQEITEALFARTLLDQAVIMWRTTGGSVAAWAALKCESRSSITGCVTLTHSCQVGEVVARRTGRPPGSPHSGHWPA